MTNVLASRFSLAAELGACEAASRWSRADLASALARVEIGARLVVAEAERARDDASSIEGGPDSQRGDVETETKTLVDLRRCEASFARFVDESKPRRRALSALAEYVDAKFGALCAYVGEGGDLIGDSRPSSRREGNRDENENAFLTGPSRDVSELFGGLWAFAASVDAARERRLAFAEARSSFSFRAADVDRRAISCD